MRIILSVLLLVLSATPVWAKTVYVGKTGSDANNCTTAQTIGTPKLTIAGGLSCMAAGDTLYIRTGTYTERLLETSFGATGTSGNVITVSNYNGEVVTVRPTGGGGNVVRFQDSSIHHVIINGLVLDGINAGGQGGASVIYCQSHDLTFQNNDITNGDGNGVLCDGDGYKFLNNRIFTNGLYSGYAESNGMYLEGITNSIVERNEVYNNEAVGVRVWNSGASPKANTNIVRYNRIYQNGFGIGLSGTSTSSSGGGGLSIGDSDNLVYRNIVTGNYIGAQVNSSGRRTLLHHNTFYSNVADVVIDSGAQNTEVKNSILYNSGSGLINNGTSTTTATNQTSNPSFVNAAGSDFALSASSTAINAGTNIGYTYNGAAPDIGAHETWGCSSGEVGSVDATSLIITCTNNLNPPILPSTGITGMTARENGGAVTVNGCVRSGSNLIDCTLNASITGGTTVDFSYSTGTGNLTDSACIGSGTCASGSQRLNAITNQSVTNNVSGAPSTTLTQTYSRIHGLRGTEAAPVVKATSSYPVVVGGKVRIRLKVACTGGDCDALGMALRYSKNGGSYTAVPDSFDADNIAFIGNGVDPDIPASGTATTEQLTSDHSGMVACAIVRTSGAIPNVDLSQNSETECEYAVAFDTDATAGDAYDFRLYNQNGNALGAYSVTPRLTVTAMAASGGR